ncbi:MAG: hypothetical protein ACYDEN_11615 [Acidimicrobiales bacterium]
MILDLGYGTPPRLLACCESSAVDGIDADVVTHSHPDHMVGLHGLFRAHSGWRASPCRTSCPTPASACPLMAWSWPTPATRAGPSPRPARPGRRHLNRRSHQPIPIARHPTGASGTADAPVREGSRPSCRSRGHQAPGPHALLARR